MSFQEKSAWVLIIVTLIVAADFIFGLARNGGIATAGGIFPSIIFFVILVTIIHIAIAVINPKETDTADERDYDIERKGEVIGSYTLAAFMLFILAAAALSEQWLIANVAFLGLMASELAKCLWQVLLYRRSA